jgi:hypothetical protein
VSVSVSVFEFVFEGGQCERVRFAARGEDRPLSLTLSPASRGEGKRLQRTDPPSLRAAPTRTALASRKPPSNTNSNTDTDTDSLTV